MKNKKFVKTATLLSSLMGLAILSSSLCSSVVLSNKNDSIKSETNNINKNNSINQSNFNNETLTADASYFFSGDNVSGKINYQFNSADNSITITGYDENFTITNVCFNNSITIPEVVSDCTSIIIYESAFENCKTIHGKLTFSSAIKEIQSAAFSTVDNLAYVDLSNAISVTSISDRLFSECGKLETVIFNDNILSFGNSAFANTAIKNITFPNQLNEIGGLTFTGCYNLKNLNFPASLTTIQYDAFTDCKQLTQITITSNLTNIDVAAFACDPIDNIILEDGNSAYNLVNIGKDGNGKILVNKSENPGNEWNGTAEAVGSLGYGNVDYTQYPEITEIGDALLGTNINSVKISNTITTIERYAFRVCEYLKNVEFESGSQLNSIGSDAFYGCKSLTEISIPISVKSISSEAFSYCENLSSITLNWSASDIQNIVSAGTVNQNWLSNNSSLIVVNIPEGLLSTYVQNASQLGIANLNIVDESKDAYIKASDVFTQSSDTIKGWIHCLGSSVVGVSDDFSINDASLVNERLINGSPISTISASAFANCLGIEGTLTFPLTHCIQNVYENAFYGCSNLTSIKFEGYKDLSWSSFKYRSMTIGYYAFNGCINLNEFYFPMIQGSFDKGYVKFDKNWLGNADGREIIIHIPKGMTETYQNYLQDKTCGATFMFIDDLENPEYSNLNLPLALGLGLGLGIPALCAVIGGTIYGVKKHKTK